MKVGIYYFSSTGNTKHGLLLLQQYLKQAGHNCEIFSIDDVCAIDREQFDIYGFASPVFHGYPAHKMLDFIDNLPSFPQSALAFTILCPCYKPFNIGYWGSREHFRDLLEAKNFTVIDHLGFYGEASHPAIRKIFLNNFTAKLFAAHFATGRPDYRDEKTISDFARQLQSKYENYQATGARKIHNNHLRRWLSAKVIRPFVERRNATILVKVADQNLCTKCGYCYKNCPVKAISMQPFPAFDITTCFHCEKCVNLCPHDAISFKNFQKINRFKGYRHSARTTTRNLSGVR